MLRAEAGGRRERGHARGEVDVRDVAAAQHPLAEARPAGDAVELAEVDARREVEDEGNRVVWTHRPLKSIVNRRAFEMFTDKESNREISDALGISRYKVYRLRKKFDVNPDPDSLVDE